MIYPETIVNCDNCGMLNAFNEEHFITYVAVNCRGCGQTMAVPDENKILAFYEQDQARKEVLYELEKEHKYPKKPLFKDMFASYVKWVNGREVDP